MSESIVFIVDDDQEVREALSLLMESVGLKTRVCDSAQAFLDIFDESLTGCLLLDGRLPGMSGLDLQAQLASEKIHPPIIILTGHGDVPMAVRAVQAGAIDFIEKPFNEQALLDSVHRAIERDAEQRGEASRRADIEQRIASLTPREKEVLKLVAAGKRNKIIADELSVSQSTVEAHRKRVMEKMEASSLSDLMRMVLLLEPAGQKC